MFLRFLMIWFLGKFIIMGFLALIHGGVHQEEKFPSKRALRYDLCPPNRHHLLPHESDPTKFYYCENGMKFIIPRDCAPGTEFSYKRQVCVHPSLNKRTVHFNEQLPPESIIQPPNTITRPKVLDATKTDNYEWTKETLNNATKEALSFTNTLRAENITILKSSNNTNAIQDVNTSTKDAINFTKRIAEHFANTDCFNNTQSAITTSSETFNNRKNLQEVNNITLYTIFNNTTQETIVNPKGAPTDLNSTLTSNKTSDNDSVLTNTKPESVIKHEKAQFPTNPAKTVNVSEVESYISCNNTQVTNIFNAAAQLLNLFMNTTQSFVDWYTANMSSAEATTVANTTQVSMKKYNGFITTDAQNVTATHSPIDWDNTKTKFPPAIEVLSSEKNMQATNINATESSLFINITIESNNTTTGASKATTTHASNINLSNTKQVVNNTANDDWNSTHAEGRVPANIMHGANIETTEAYFAYNENASDVTAGVPILTQNTLRPNITTLEAHTAWDGTQAKNVSVAKIYDKSSTKSAQNMTSIESHPDLNTTEAIDIAAIQALRSIVTPVTNISTPKSSILMNTSQVGFMASAQDNNWKITHASTDNTTFMNIIQAKGTNTSAAPIQIQVTTEEFIGSLTAQAESTTNAEVTYSSHAQNGKGFAAEAYNDWNTSSESNGFSIEAYFNGNTSQEPITISVEATFVRNTIQDKSVIITDEPVFHKTKKKEISIATEINNFGNNTSNISKTESPIFINSSAEENITITAPYTNWNIKPVANFTIPKISILTNTKQETNTTPKKADVDGNTLDAELRTTTEPTNSSSTIQHGHIITTEAHFIWSSSDVPVDALISTINSQIPNNSSSDFYTVWNTTRAANATWDTTRAANATNTYIRTKPTNMLNKTLTETFDLKTTQAQNTTPKHPLIFMLTKPITNKTVISTNTANVATAEAKIYGNATPNTVIAPSERPTDIKELDFVWDTKHGINYLKSYAAILSKSTKKSNISDEEAYTDLNTLQPIKITPTETGIDPSQAAKINTDIFFDSPNVETNNSSWSNTEKLNVSIEARFGFNSTDLEKNTNKYASYFTTTRIDTNIITAEASIPSGSTQEKIIIPKRDDRYTTETALTATTETGNFTHIARKANKVNIALTEEYNDWNVTHAPNINSTDVTTFTHTTRTVNVTPSVALNDNSTAQAVLINSPKEKKYGDTSFAFNITRDFPIYTNTTQQAHRNITAAPILTNSIQGAKITSSIAYIDWNSTQMVNTTQNLNISTYPTKDTKITTIEAPFSSNSDVELKTRITYAELNTAEVTIPSYSYSQEPGKTANETYFLRNMTLASNKTAVDDEILTNFTKSPKMTTEEAYTDWITTEEEKVIARAPTFTNTSPSMNVTTAEANINWVKKTLSANYTTSDTHILTDSSQVTSITTTVDYKNTTTMPNAIVEETVDSRHLIQAANSSSPIFSNNSQSVNTTTEKAKAQWYDTPIANTKSIESANATQKANNTVEANYYKHWIAKQPTIITIETPILTNSVAFTKEEHKAGITLVSKVGTTDAPTIINTTGGVSITTKAYIGLSTASKQNEFNGRINVYDLIIATKDAPVFPNSTKEPITSTGVNIAHNIVTNEASLDASIIGTSKLAPITTRATNNAISTTRPYMTGFRNLKTLPNGCPVSVHIHQLLPHLDCTKFYYCVFGVKVERQCPGGLRFNPKIQVCDWPYAAGCSNGLDNSNKH